MGLSAFDRLRFKSCCSFRKGRSTAWRNRDSWHMLCRQGLKEILKASRFLHAAFRKFPLTLFIEKKTWLFCVQSLASTQTLALANTTFFILMMWLLADPSIVQWRFNFFIMLRCLPTLFCSPVCFFPHTKTVYSVSVPSSHVCISLKLQLHQNTEVYQTSLNAF